MLSILRFALRFSEEEETRGSEKRRAEVRDSVPPHVGHAARRAAVRLRWLFSRPVVTAIFHLRLLVKGNWRARDAQNYPGKKEIFCKI